ncbi:TolC family protein [Zavarzinella formosa]|uniref:TolC family protein n=1 Tax=Zavarzinella formosa TaxID=360055 RepID=UPI0002D85219|nr:TolC family protein [Zavarzinella formosa]
MKPLRPAGIALFACVIGGFAPAAGSSVMAQKGPVFQKPERVIDLPPVVAREEPKAEPREMPKAKETPRPLNELAPLPQAGTTKPVTVTRFTLAEALRTGHANHPSLKALQNDIMASQQKMQGLKEAHFITGGLVPDLKYRRQQLELGEQANAAELAQAEHDVTYAVVRSFYTVIYAREQAKIARDLVDQLDLYLEQVRKIVNSKGGGVKGITKDTEDKMVILIAEARGKMEEADSGVARARASLREAIGLSPNIEVDTADELLPEVQAEFTKEAIVNHALTRRGEIRMANIGAQVTQLEVVAQWSRKLSVRVPTFANGGDLHAKPIPVASREPDYKPGAIPPEMPAELVGHQKTRTAIAQQYYERSEKVVEQARNLVALESEVGYARYIEATKKVAIFKEASKAGRSLLERQREATGGNLTKEDILMNEVSVTRSFASFNQSLYEQIIALANLERISAGGVHVNFPGR